MTAEVSDPIPLPGTSEKVCYVIYTAESDVAPHFLNGRKGVYVRTDEFSARFEARLADENELQHLLDRRKLARDRRTSLLDRARRRFRTYASRTQIDQADKTKLGSLLELCIVPRFPARPICEQGRLKTLVSNNVLTYRGGGFPLLNRIVCQHESAIVLKPLRNISIFEANAWGMLFYCTQIDAEYNEGRGIHLYQLVGNVLLFIQHAGKMLAAMGQSGPLLLETALASVLSMPLLYDARGWMESKQGAELDDDVAFSIATTSESLRERPDGIAMDILNNIFFAVNWPELVADPEKFADLVRNGYAYNAWSVPTNLRV